MAPKAERKADNPWEVLARSQRAAAGLMADALTRLLEMGKVGVPKPDDVLRELTAVVTAMGQLAGATARPLEAFLTSQRQLAETMDAFAVLQRQLADVMETAAANHKAVVEALDLLTAPVVGVAQRLRQEGRE